MTIDVKEWHPIVPKNVCEIDHKGDKFLCSEDSVEHYVKYWNAKKSADLGKIGYNDLEVRLVRTSSGNCYSSATYELKSPRELTDRDLEVVRCDYKFQSSGQSHAVKRGCVKTDDGKFIYTLFSEVDSGD